MPYKVQPGVIGCAIRPAITGRDRSLEEMIYDTAQPALADAGIDDRRYRRHRRRLQRPVRWPRDLGDDGVRPGGRRGSRHHVHAVRVGACVHPGRVARRLRPVPHATGRRLEPDRSRRRCRRRNGSAPIRISIAACRWTSCRRMRCRPSALEHAVPGLPRCSRATVAAKNRASRRAGVARSAVAARRPGRRAGR